MHEIQRITYLQALGIDAYVSRRQLPGAAPSQRLMLVSKPEASEVVSPSTGAGNTPGSAAQLLSQNAYAKSAVNVPTPSGDTQEAAVAASLSRAPGVQFSMSAIVAGDFLWLESLGDMPLATEQVALIQAMAHAMRMAAVAASTESAAMLQKTPRPDLARFDWPMHSNQQFDNGREAAATALAAFLGRRIEQFSCRGVVLLGEECAAWLQGTELNVVSVTTQSTLTMINNPASKVGVWHDLAALRC